MDEGDIKELRRAISDARSNLELALGILDDAGVTRGDLYDTVDVALEQLELIRESAWATLPVERDDGGAT